MSISEVVLDSKNTKDTDGIISSTVKIAENHKTFGMKSIFNMSDTYVSR